MPADFDSIAYSDGDIAIVGMAAHLPGAPNIETFWKNLETGTESIRRLSEKELTKSGEPLHLIRNPNYVPAAAVLDDFEQFDGEFFGLSPKESAIMDPQHRQFLECSWEALENAGHPPESIDGPVGVYAGCGMGSYFYFNICSNPDLVDDTGMFLLRHTGNDKDFLSTRLSHILDLTGPSVNIQTACSTSLVATHYACQALQNAECDMALAGGVTIELPHGRGYVFQEGEILSPDGHCHAFDHRAQGTVFGSGVGVVVLRRIEDAIRDGDHIWAVIKGTAINNDGAAKAGYLAPSVDGQSAAISEAHAMAGVNADTIDYVECHGTGTYLGDPIEVAALTDAFRETSHENGFCRIGSVKTNIGHLDTAAGVASLIKVSMSLKNEQIPPTLGFEAPNPAIDFPNSPFRVNNALTPWESFKGPKRAGVNSLGVGGTNAHAVVEEAPDRGASDESDWPFQLLTLSARSNAALDDASANLAEALPAMPDTPLADIAWTLKEGRRAFDKRLVVVAETHEEAAKQLKENNTRRVFTHSVVADNPNVVFMFPGGGAQYANMARDLYETEPVFQDWMDRGLEILQERLDFDIREIWLPEEGSEATANETLRTPSVQLPLIMITEYALAELWMSWGVQPSALIGHSMGENTAACVSGVLSFEDCIALVHLRGKLFDTVPSGGMLSVPISAEELRPHLGDELDLAAENGPFLSVASGPRDALDRLKTRLEKERIECQDIPIDIAAHSRMLEPILEEFRTFLKTLHFEAPSIPFISNRTGIWIKASEAMNPDYWVEHLRNSVMFANGISTLAEDDERVYIEVGPGKALASLTQSHPDVSSNQVISSLRHEQDDVGDDAYFLAMLGRCWATGVNFDWGQIWGDQKRHRVPLPTYPFQRSPYFIEPGKLDQRTFAEPPTRINKVSDWGFKPTWRPKTADCPLDIAVDLAEAKKEVWLVFLDDAGLGQTVADTLRKAGQIVVTVNSGDDFARDGDQAYILSTERGREGYVSLLSSLMSRGLAPTRIAHFWLTTHEETFRPGSSFFHRNIEQGFFSLTFLLQAMEDVSLPKPVHITAITSDSMQVRAEALRYPEKAMISGPLRVAPREFSDVTCGQLDISVFTDADEPAIDHLALPVLEELLAVPSNTIAAYRNGRRFELGQRSEKLPPIVHGKRLKDAKTFFITGGFGGIGLSLARHFAKTKRANFVLLTRDTVPPRDQWADYLTTVAPTDRTAQRIAAIREIEELGGKIMPCMADISNLEEMQKAVADAKAEFGTIDVVIHSAGVLDDGPILGRRMVETETVFAPKLHGTQVLERVFPDGSVKEMVLFSSTSTITAPTGQSDYVAANEFLNAYAKSRKGGKTKVTAINWGIWSDVGMAANVVNPEHFDPQSVPATDVDAPMLSRAHFDPSGNRAFLKDFRASEDWVFDEHRTIDGKALMPGTGYIELAAQALREQREKMDYEIQNLFFLSPFHVADGQSRTMRSIVSRSEKGYQFRVQSSDAGLADPEWVSHCEADILISGQDRPAPIDLKVIMNRMGADTDAQGGDPIASPQEHHLGFGPRWRTLISEAKGEGEGIAKLHLNPAASDDQGYIMHPALLDIATGWAIRLVPGYSGQKLWVPMSYQSVRVHAPLTDEIYSWARLSPRQTDFSTIASVDVTICDKHGNVLVDVFGFQMQMQDNPAFLSSETLLQAPSEKDTVSDSQSGTSGNARLKHQLSQGIPSADGVKLFERAIETDLSQVIVSSMDINKLVENTTKESLELLKNTATSFQRPKLESEYAQPSTEVERTLAEFWEELLGVQDVGVDDSFFELGGHSLIAVRLFAQIRKSFGVNFPISVLFEAPTIRACAKLIEDQVGRSETGSSDSDSGKSERRFKHLVAMHDGEGGPRNPFFLVAGMFGNVLNLRHLAHLLGEDRPFYGLQARGLLGDDTPHETIETAAKDYIEEMRAIQPNGPYYLGGYSGGGIFALEVAQQLKAMGEQTQLLVLLDTPLPQRRPVEKLDRLLMQIQNIRERGWNYPREWLMGRLAWKAKQRQKAEDLQETRADHQFHSAEIEAAFLKATDLYSVSQWRGSTVLYRPPLVGKWQVSKGRLVSDERHYVFHDNDWGDLLPALTITEVPGDHDSMVLEPNVRVLANRLRRELEKAERDALLAGPTEYARAAE